MATCLLALGANLGDCRPAIDQAIAALEATGALRIAYRSATHTTAPIGGPDAQPSFANAAAVVETLLDPQALLGELHAIEQQFGRQPGERWAARPLDLDLLLYGGQVIRGPALCVPHPRMSYRPFVLDPAVEIAGDWPHPELGATLAELHQRLHHGANVVVLYGGTAAAREWHAERLAEQFAGLRIDSSGGDVYLSRAAGVATGKPKLALHLHNPGDTPRPGIPTLGLPPASREEVVFDTSAALLCIWPDLCCRATRG